MTLDEAAPASTLTDGWKANFDDIYDQPDPRRYLAELGTLDYSIPHHADCATLSSDEMVEVDRAWYAERRRAAPRVAGLDISQPAVGYGERVGLLHPGAAENLEQEAASTELASVVADTDLITVTGGVGYITTTTFEHLLERTGDGPSPWVAAFVLRQLSYHDIADVLAEHGLVTERLTGRTFPQRRFASEDEQVFTLRYLEESGLDATGLEFDGALHTEFYLSRPAADVAAQPLSTLVPA